MQMETALPVANPSTQSQETDLEVGRWGEELVYRFLLQHQRDSAQAWQVHWVNQAFNTGTPYDISLRQVAGADAVLGEPTNSAKSHHCRIVARCSLTCTSSLVATQFSL